MKNAIVGAVLAAGLLFVGVGAAEAAPRKAPVAASWTCGAGEIAAPLTYAGAQYKGCYNPVTKKWRIVGVIG